jgi:DNA polymerase III alpha subunit
MNLTSNFSKYKLDLFKKGVRLPEIKISDKDRQLLGLKLDTTNTEYLKKLCWKKCQERMLSGQIKQTKEQCIDRLKMEFSVFEKTNTIDYILLLMDIYLWCDDNNVLRGPARGSAAASFALFCLGLTRGVNPLDYELNFTRFLSEARAKVTLHDGISHVDGKSMCDFDGDIEYFGREKCLNRMADVYKGKMCKILTLQYLTGKTALKDTVKSLLEYSESDALDLGGEIESIFGKVDSLDKTLEKSKKINHWVKTPDGKLAFTVAKRIEGLLRGVGIHASGVLLSYYKIEDMLPTELSANGEEVSGFDMSECLQVSVKADILGLRTLTQLSYIEEITGVKCENIDVNDPTIYQYYLDNRKCFAGLFQIEDGITKEATLKIKPKNIEELAIVVAISRPGGMKHIDAMAKFTNTGEYKSFYPAIDIILNKTGSIILYQEQINDICQKVYGMKATDADEVRRAIGKKSKKDMEKWEPLVTQNGLDRGIPEEVTKKFWQTCIEASDYLFNKAHAVSYSYLTAYTTYFKTNYPKEFFLSCLKIAHLEANPIEYITKFQGELETFGIKLLQPDIILSDDDFTIEGENIRMGKKSVKGLSDTALDKLRSFKASVNSPFELFLSLSNAKIPLNVVASLILSGCVDSQLTAGKSRNCLLLEFEIFNELTPRELPIILNLGAKYNYDLPNIIKLASTQLKNESGKLLINEKRIQTLRRDTETYFNKFRRNEKFKELTIYLAENYYLGFSYSYSLKSIYSNYINGLYDLRALKHAPPSFSKDSYICVVQIAEIESRTSRSKKNYVRYMLKDDTDTLLVMDFQLDQRDEKIYKEDMVCVFHLTKKQVEDGGFIYFVNDIIEQEVPTVLKASVVRKELEEKEKKIIKQLYINR